MQSIPMWRKRAILFAEAAVLATASTWSPAPSYARGSWASTSTNAYSSSIAQFHGPVSAQQPVHIVVALKLRSREVLEQRVASMIWRPRLQAMTPAQVEAAFTPTAQQAKAVVDYLALSGFTDMQVAKNRVLVTANGTASGVLKAFNARLELVSRNGRTGFANRTPAQVPTELQDIVEAVLGLQNVEMARPLAVAGPNVLPLCQTQNPGGLVVPCGGSSASGIEPPTLGTVYGAAGLPPAAGASVGIIAEGNVSESVTDLQKFARQL